VHTRIVEKQLKYLRYIAVQSCSQWPKKQQHLIFKDKHQCWRTVFGILNFLCEAGSEITGKW